MSKQTFEELVLKSLKTLQDTTAKIQQEQLAMRKDQKVMQKDLHRLEVLQEATYEEVEKLLEIMGAQKEMLETKASKQDLDENESSDKLIKMVVKTHSGDIAGLKRRVVRLET